MCRMLCGSVLYVRIVAFTLVLLVGGGRGAGTGVLHALRVGGVAGLHARLPHAADALPTLPVQHGVKPRGA